MKSIGLIFKILKTNQMVMKRDLNKWCMIVMNAVMPLFSLLGWKIKFFSLCSNNLQIYSDIHLKKLVNIYTALPCSNDLCLEISLKVLCSIPWKSKSNLRRNLVVSRNRPLARVKFVLNNLLSGLWSGSYDIQVLASIPCFGSLFSPANHTQQWLQWG